MMEHVEEDEVRDLAIAERKGVSILDLIDPRIGKQVGAQTVGYDIADVADTGAELNDPAGDRLVDVGGDAAVKVPVGPLQYRLALPRLPVLVDLDVVLIDRKGRPRTHRGAAPALSRNRPIKVMRSSISPWRNR